MSNVDELPAFARNVLDGGFMKWRAEGLPVSARPDSAGYRLRKFVRRHRVAVTASSECPPAQATAMMMALLTTAQNRPTAR